MDHLSPELTAPEYTAPKHGAAELSRILNDARRIAAKHGIPFAAIFTDTIKHTHRGDDQPPSVDAAHRQWIHQRDDNCDLFVTALAMLMDYELREIPPIQMYLRLVAEVLETSAIHRITGEMTDANDEEV